MHSDYLLLRPVDFLEHIVSSDYDASLETYLDEIAKKSCYVLTFSKGSLTLHVIITLKLQKACFLKYYDTGNFFLILGYRIFVYRNIFGVRVDRPTLILKIKGNASLKNVSIKEMSVKPASSCQRGVFLLVLVQFSKKVKALCFNILLQLCHQKKRSLISDPYAMHLIVLKIS